MDEGKQRHMTEQYISYETAELAHKTGFDINTYYCYGETQEYYYEDVRNHGDDIKSEYRPPHIMPRYFIVEHSHNTFLCPAPTQSLLHKWLRDEYGIYVSIYPLKSGWAYDIRKIKQPSPSLTLTYEGSPSYESALEKGLNEGLKLI